MTTNLPIAADGTSFGPHLYRAGGFKVGPKSAERKVADFQDAVAYLKSLPKAYWRRPNSRGNWGIVTEVAWAEIKLS